MADIRMAEAREQTVLVDKTSFEKFLENLEDRTQAAEKFQHARD